VIKVLTPHFLIPIYFSKLVLLYLLVAYNAPPTADVRGLADFILNFVSILLAPTTTLTDKPRIGRLPARVCPA